MVRSFILAYKFAVLVAIIKFSFYKIIVFNLIIKLYKFVRTKAIHFMTKIELFKGIEGVVVRNMGCIPVNRKIHDGDSLKSAKEELRKGEVIGIFPEGTINRTDNILMPFKIGAVKMSNDTDSVIVPFVIKGKYNIIGKSISIEFLKSRKISSDLEKENKKLRDEISKKLEEFN